MYLKIKFFTTKFIIMLNHNFIRLAMPEKKPKVKYEVEFIKDLTKTPKPMKKTFPSKQEAEEYCKDVERKAGLCVLNRLEGKKRSWEFRK